MALRILLLALAIMSSSAQAQSWIDSIVQGDDKSASNQLSHIAQAQEAYDLMTLSNQLRRGVSNCPEKDKKILFRGYRNPAFENVGTAKRRIYLSRALMTQKGGSNPNGFADLKGVNLHSFISTCWLVQNLSFSIFIRDLKSLDGSIFWGHGQLACPKDM